MRSKNEQGAALITALLVMSSFTLLTAAIVFTVQNDVQMSANYKYGQQAYYVANAGIQRSLDWFNTSTGYASLPASNYDATKVPLQYGGQTVTFSGKPGIASNFPTAATVTSYESILNNSSLTAPDNKSTGTIQVDATLLRSTSVNLLSTASFIVSPGVLERWRLDSIGLWGSSTNPVGRSEVSGVIENQGAPLFGRALWTSVSATLGSTGLPSYIDSYDSSLGPYGGANVGSDGDIGSNGNISLSGGSVIHGAAMYMGTFGSWDSAPYTNSVTDGVSALTQAKVFPPIPAFGVGTTTILATNGQYIDPGTYATISVTGGKNLNLRCGNYYINTLSVISSTITLDPTCSNYTFYIKSGLGITSSSSIVNTPQDPSKLQIFYPGTTKATLAGGSGFHGVVYAPNAQLDLSDPSQFYGSFMAKILTISQGGSVHYDNALRKQFIIASPYRLITWTQKNY